LCGPVFSPSSIHLRAHVVLWIQSLRIISGALIGSHCWIVTGHAAQQLGHVYCLLLLHAALLALACREYSLRVFSAVALSVACACPGVDCWYASICLVKGGHQSCQGDGMPHTESPVKGKSSHPQACQLRVLACPCGAFLAYFDCRPFCRPRTSPAYSPTR
jgi:hypothetical protein